MNDSDDRPAAEALPKDEDWRGNDGTHRRLALGCTMLVVLALLAFWIARGALMG
jgi:hypothetical protein